MSLSTTVQELLVSTTEEPPTIVRQEVEKLNGIDFVDEAERAAVVMRRLYRRTQATKAAQLWLVDQVYLRGMWVTDDNRFDTLMDWIDFAMEGLEVFGSFRTILNTWATVIAPGLRRYEVVDPVTWNRITPDYMIASAGWAKISDVTSALAGLSKNIQWALSSAPLSSSDQRWLAGAEQELRRRLEIVSSWIVRPDMRRRDAQFHQDLDALLKWKGWRQSRAPVKPLGLATKRWTQGKNYLAVGDLAPDEINWLKENRLGDVLAYNASSLEEIIGV